MSDSIRLEIIPQESFTSIRICQQDEKVHMVMMSYSNSDLNFQLGQYVWDQFESFIQLMESYELKLYGHYLMRDGQMMVNLADQQLLISQFLSQVQSYDQLMQGLISTYNQKFLAYQANSSVRLLMQINNPEISSLYSFNQDQQLQSKSDHGINLIFPQDLTVPGKAIGFTIDFGVIGESVYSTGYLLIPRSSIGKTPLRQANSIGLIESTYRGHLMAKVDNVSDQPYQIKKGTSLFQVVQANLVNNWSVQLVPMCGQTQEEVEDLVALESN